MSKGNGGGLPDPLKIHTAKSKGGFGLADPLNLFDSKDAPPSPPDPLDPRLQIAAEARAMPSVYSPFGNAVFSGDPTAGTFRQDITLSPEEMALYRGRSGVAQAMLNRAGDKELTSSYEFRGAEDPTTNRFFTQQKKLLDKAFDEDEERLEQRLANQGLPMGGEAFDGEFDNFRQSRADSLERASTNALTEGFRQDLTERQQNFNEIAAALGGAQLTPVGTAGSGPDVSNAFTNYQAGRNNQFNAQMGAYNADVAQQNQTMGTAGTIGASVLMFL